MRFIRDIIKEKRATAPSAADDAVAGTALDAPVEPLVLKTPLTPEAQEPMAMETSAAPAPEAELDAQASFMAMNMADDDELAEYEDYDDDDDEVQSMLEAIDRERMAQSREAMANATQEPVMPEPQTVAEEETHSAAATEDNFFLDAADDTEEDKIDVAAQADETTEAVEDTEEDVADLDLPDPFERLRESRETAVSISRSISPMRRNILSPVEPAAEPQAPKAVAVPPTEEAPEELKPLADAMDAPVQMPSPAKGRGSGRSGRVKTRLLGFNAAAIEQKDPFAAESGAGSKFPVGWLVVVSEMGRGESFALKDGVTKVGRGTDQTVCLNFGDNSISRDNHISIAYDAEQNKFFVGHSGKTNLVRINNIPLLSTEELKSKDLIRLGETTLRFISFCADDFSWAETEEQVAKHA